MTSHEYRKKFREYCEYWGSTEKGISKRRVMDFNRETRWTGMEIDYVTREVNDNPLHVAKVVALGENDGGVYAVIVNLVFGEMYVFDCNGNLVEETSLRIENGRFVGEMQSYI